MKPPRPRLWHLALSIVPLAFLFNHYRPFSPRDAIRIALPAARKEYPGLLIDERSAAVSRYSTANYSGLPAWNVKFSGPAWEVLIVVSSDGSASRPCWFPLPEGPVGPTAPAMQAPRAR